MTELHELLERATDRLEAPDLAATALVESRRRRFRTRSAVAVTVAAASVALVMGVSQLGSGDSDSRPPVDTPSPSFPTPTPPTDADPATQPLWDRFDIAQAPVRSTTVPQPLDPAEAEGLTPRLDPMSGVVVAWRGGSDLRLLGTDGRWRIVPVSDSTSGLAFGVDNLSRPAISFDGMQVAVATEDGILVIDVRSGGDRTIPWPERFAPPWDNQPEVRWQPGNKGFIVMDFGRTWLVELDGTSREAPYRSQALGIDPAGPVYQNDFEARTLLTWQDDEVVDEAPFIQCQRMVAGYGMVACTAGSMKAFESGPVVVDPTTGDVIAYAPIKDRHAVYSDNGGLTLLGFLDQDTLLMLVGPAAFHDNDVEEERFLASWQFRTGEFQRISTGGSDMRSIAVAPELVE